MSGRTDGDGEPRADGEPRTADCDPPEATDDAAEIAPDDLVETHVVTVFLRNDSDVLLLERSDAVGSYSGRWGAVAGHAEGGPDAAAREEIREETRLDPGTDAALVRRGDPFAVTDADLGTRWVVHPYLFDCDTRSVDPNEETAAYEWAPPTAILRRETVPDLWASYDRVRPTPESIAGDGEHGAAYISVRALEVLRDEAAVAVERGDDPGAAWSDLTAVARDLLDARPAMAVVANRVNGVVHRAGESATPAALEAAAHEGIERASTADGDAAALAAGEIPDSVASLSRSGTVASALERADPAEVLVAESRPGREGVETAERLTETTDAAVTLTTDAALADRLAAMGADALVVGADTILPDGRVVNKVGTRAAATAAASEGIDCLVVAASDKIAPERGRPDEAARSVDREERDPAEVYDGDADLRVANPTFDVTPADRIGALVTERGVLDVDAVGEVAAEHRALADWQ
ncbi:NUDIX domain-containing protein [Halosimplex aquaticum]|uniref:NUDIX domain-containing protein n=1 Tax=Halosimplex aquaticum TaxID=3026162 RepID=A0ABD5Y1Q4_9EURY|nr:NUDIX domain-containing protein [Halosimplex aquaticum]